MFWKVLPDPMEPEAVVVVGCLDVLEGVIIGGVNVETVHVVACGDVMECVV